MSEPDLDIEKYRSGAGVESKTANISGDDHALKERFGSDESQKAFEFDPGIIAERIADWYDDPAAALREYLSNAETACVRRAKMELRNAGISPPDEVVELFKLAEEECDYEPIIEVTYSRKSEDTRLTIEDNGCGMTTTEYQVLRKIGYSASHDEGNRLGQFGMGILSFAQLTGTENPIQCSTRSFPTNDRPEDAYSLLMYVTNLEYLDDLRESYGTRFEFPTFSGKSQNVDVRSKVAEFADGMQVPVLYREKDESGQECFNEDYLATPMEDDYPEGALTLVAENEFFKAVMSPESPEGRGNVTYNISQPIRRNDSQYNHRQNQKFEAKWTWDFRGKQEDGPVVSCESKPSIVGLSPVSDTQYDGLPDEQKEDAVPRSEVPDDAIVMPKPASSRDSYEANHQSFWKYVSKQLQEEWADEVSDVYGKLDSWDAFMDLSRSEKQTIIRSYRDFGPGYGESDSQTIQDSLEDSLGVTVSLEVCDRIDALHQKVNVVPEEIDTGGYGTTNMVHNDRAHQKGILESEKVWKVLDEYDNVYVGKSISQKKAEIVWGLDENAAVVRVDDTDKYDEYDDMFGWDLLKNLPASNLKEKLDIDDDVAEKWENKSTSSSNNTNANRRTSRDPETKRINVRYDKGKGRYFSSPKAGDVFDRLDNDKTISAGYKSFKFLLLYDQTEVDGSTPPLTHTSWNSDTAVTAVPKYVYNYLKDAEHAFTSYSDLKSYAAKSEKEDVDTNDVIIFTDDAVKEHYEGDVKSLIREIRDRSDDMPDLSQYTTDDVDVKHYDDMGGCDYLSESDLDAVTLGVNSNYGEVTIGLTPADVYITEHVPDVDRDAPEWDDLFPRTPNRITDDLKRKVKMIEAMGGTFPSQDDGESE